MTDTESDSDELETPIKIRWAGEARMKINSHNLDFDSEKSERVTRTLDRQKTNAVIETVDEAEALANEMDRYRHDAGFEGRSWVNGAIASACDRIRGEIITAMGERGYEDSGPSRRIQFTEIPEDRLTPERLVEQAHDIIADHGAATIRQAGYEWTVDDPDDIHTGEGEGVRIGNAAMFPNEHTEIEPAGGDA